MRMPAEAVTTIAFTASRTLDDNAKNLIRVSLENLPRADRYVTGACTGGDAFIGRWLAWHRRDAEHVVVVPGDLSRVDFWFQRANVTVVEMPAHSTYYDRNKRLVKEADLVQAFPAYAEQDYRSLRSGTWQTIRMARRAGKETVVRVLSP